MIRTALLLTSLAAALPAQSASVSLYGTGCSFVGQQLSIGVQGLPQLGTTITFTYSGPNMINQLTVQPVLVLGLGTANVPLPATLLPQQPPNCTAWITPDVLNVMPPLPGGSPFQSQFPMAIPSSNSLIGFQFAAQWLAIAIQCGIIPPCALSAFPTSDAALLTVGL
jgi:hypothetical protein